MLLRIVGNPISSQYTEPNNTIPAISQMLKEIGADILAKIQAIRNLIFGSETIVQGIPGMSDAEVGQAQLLNKVALIETRVGEQQEPLKEIIQILKKEGRSNNFYKKLQETSFHNDYLDHYQKSVKSNPVKAVRPMVLDREAIAFFEELSRQTTHLVPSTVDPTSPQIDPFLPDQ